MTSPSLTVARTGTHHGTRRRSSHRGTSALMYAAQQGDVERVRTLLRDQPKLLFHKDRSGKSPLHYCCTSDNICAAQAADILVMAAPELVESRDEDGFTALHLAVIAGNMSLVTFLLANKVDVNAMDNEKHTVVHWATVCGETMALRAVLAAGAPVSTPDVHKGYPLHYAAQMCGGDKDSDLGFQVLQTLLTHSDIVVTVEDGDGRQPLLWAASAGSAKALLALIRAGSLVEASDKDGLTALHCAASRGHTDCIDTLLTLCGASPDVIDSNGCTALHYAVTLGHADATALLLAHGADPNRQDRKGRSPAHCGCCKGQFETVKMIGARGGNLWLRNARGDLPLHEASASGRRDLVKWLLEMRPSQVNARNNDGRCPIHLAALNDNADMCKILIDTGSQVNPILRTSKNLFMTPLDCALQRGFRSTAKYLQLHGGVPANRLVTSHQQVNNSAVSLQIRDDVTFWGDTSTDSERENGEKDHAKHKKIHRKKLAYKYERKRTSISGSDLENKAFSVKLDSSKTKSKSRERNKPHKTGVTRDGAPSLIDSKFELKSSPRSRLDYSNEIIINGNTEINIHQTREISVEKDSDKLVSSLKVPLGKFQTDISVSSAEKEKQKRPRSAKYSRLKSKKDKSGNSTPTQTSARSSAKSESSAVILKSRGDLEKDLKLLKHQSTNTSEETLNTVIENPEQAKVSAIIIDNENIAAEGIKLPDQQSLLSNTTSEEMEESKSIIVEASIHEAPKTDDVRNENNHEEMLTEEVIGPEITPKDHDETEANTTISTINEFEKPQEATDRINAEDDSAATNSEQNDNLKQEVEESQQILTDQGKKLQVLTEMVEGKIIPNEIISNSERIQQDADGIKLGEELITEKDEDEFPDVVESQSTESDITCTDPLMPHTKSEVPETEINNNTNKTLTGATDLEYTVSEDIEAKSEGLSMIPNSISVSKADVVKNEWKNKNKRRQKIKMQSDQADSSLETKTSDEDIFSSQPSESSISSVATTEEHKSFRVLNDKEANDIKIIGKQPTKKVTRKSRSPQKDQRSRSEENVIDNKSNERDKLKRSKIPTPLIKTPLSKSDKHLDQVDSKVQVGLEMRIPSLPNIHQAKDGRNADFRSESNLSAPLLKSIYSDNERDSASDDLEERRRSSSVRKKRTKRRLKTRESHSAGSDYESSNLIDSGFEPSPRSSRIPKWKNMSERGVNMTSVTQNIQSNIRRYHLERKIFQHLLDLKRLQIRSGQHNEALLVKRAIDSYHNTCAATVGAGKYVPEDFTFKSFEKFLYHSLRKLQRNGTDYLKGLPENQPNPLLCTKSTHRCMHATHAYTGIPCAAYLPRMDHHTIPKIGFNSCKPGTGFLPNINTKKAVTLELCHGNDKQIISLPAERLDQNKRYYVTFTVKGNEVSSSATGENKKTTNMHRHSRSD